MMHRYQNFVTIPETLSSTSVGAGSLLFRSANMSSNIGTTKTSMPMRIRMTIAPTATG
jgi:hypothetical protein